MPSKEFSSDDVIEICSEIAKADNIIVQLPSKRSVFRKSSMESPSRAVRKSSIARKLSLVNGIPCENGGAIAMPESPRINEVTSAHIANRKEDIPGLKGRDIVAVAIIVDEYGLPTKTYTEYDDIPGEEIENAGQIFLSRIPIPAEKKKLRKCSSSEVQNTKALTSVLQDLEQTKRLKLFKKLDKPLSKLHTCDLNTAISFLKTERYMEVRREIKTELMLFVSGNLKMSKVNIDFV